MNKKILMGSIIAVAILILVSFTGVVGYQTTKSSTIAKASPLFTVRSSRAIDEESEDFTCDYVGKELPTLFTFPKRDNREEFVQKVIDIISKMDDETYDRYIILIINRICQDNIIKNKKIPELTNAFHHIRVNPEWLVNDIYLGEDSFLYDTSPTANIFITLCDWFQGCILQFLIGSFILLILIFIFTWIDLHPTSDLCCYVTYPETLKI